MRFCHERGMTDYVYAPKDDPKHRQDWREPYEPEMVAGFERLAGEGTLRVGFGISPGLSIDYDAADDRAALATKVDQVLGCGINLVVLALDDIPFGGGSQGGAHARLTTWLREHIGDRASLVLVPTEYVGTRVTPYLTALAEGVPDDVPIAWTGDYVVNDAITTSQAEARAASLGGRQPLVWDNYPVNDGMMADRLHLGPLWGRDADLLGACSGYLANPMVQGRASLLPLASIAGWLRGEDPVAVWAAEAESMGVRVFAEACDGAVPLALTEAAVEWLDDPSGWDTVVAPLRDWLTAARECTADVFGDDVSPWVEQVHKEARLGLDAVRLVENGSIELAFTIGFVWPSLRRAEKSVMGVRCGFAPVMGQAADGTWTFRAESLIEGRNAIDLLVRSCLVAYGS
jgi:hypothetical protein